jgi:aminotransferase
VLTRDELEVVAQIAIAHDLLVFTDEIYEYFLYDGRRHVSLASLPGMAERTITVGGYSKTFSITGWRIGYSVAAPRWTEAIGAMNDLLYVCAPTPLQAGVAAGIEALPDAFYGQLAKEYQHKRDRFCAALAQAGLPPSVPQGAYYVLADASRLPGRSGKDRAIHILQTVGVAGVPGEAFFSGGEGARYIRFSYAKTDRDLDEACRRLARLS